MWNISVECKYQQGTTCPGFSLGDNCLRDFLWCRSDFTVSCGPQGLLSNNELLCSNKKYTFLPLKIVCYDILLFTWLYINYLFPKRFSRYNVLWRFWSKAGGCWITDEHGVHRGRRCNGLKSGQCIYPVYSGHLPVKRSCDDHSNEIFDDDYLCYGGGRDYSPQEYPHCRLRCFLVHINNNIVRTDCEQRSEKHCEECVDTNLCRRSCDEPGPGCLACTNSLYFRLGNT